MLIILLETANEFLVFIVIFGLSDSFSICKIHLCAHIKNVSCNLRQEEVDLDSVGSSWIKCGSVSAEWASW